MNVFIVGFSQSGRSTVAQSLCSELDGYQHISATDWVKSTFRKPKVDEPIQHFLDEYQQYYTQRLQDNPKMIVDMVLNSMKPFGEKFFIIDGIQSPKDFAELFNYNKDLVIFLNRVDVPTPRDYENIGVSVIRDYCFWLSSAGLIDRNRWLEFNFKFDDGGNLVKPLGSKNTVIIIKGGIKKVIEVCKERLSHSEVSA